MNIKKCVSASATALLLALTTSPAQLIQLDFNDTEGDPSLVNRGSVPLTATFTNKGTGTATPVYSENVAPPNSGGRSAGSTEDGTQVNQQVINAGNVSALNNLTSLTFTGWVYNTGNTTSPQFIVDWHDSEGDGFYLYRNTDGTSLNATAGGASNITFGTSSALSLNTWTFVAITMDLTATSDNVFLYLGHYDLESGEYVLNAPIGRSINLASGNIGTSDSPLYFGNSTLQDRHWAGNLDNLRIYGSTSGSSGVLSQAQLSNVMQFNDVIPEPSTVALLCLGITAWIIRMGIRIRNAG